MNEPKKKIKKIQYQYPSELRMMSHKRRKKKKKKETNRLKINNNKMKRNKVQAAFYLLPTINTVLSRNSLKRKKIIKRKRMSAARRSYNEVPLLEKNK